MKGDISDIRSMQRNEITEYILYSKLSKKIKDKHNKSVLEHISDDELKHYNLLKSITKEEIKPKKFKIFIFNLISIILGLTFALKLMELGEPASQQRYYELSKKFPSVKKLIKDEHRHETELLNLLKEEKLEYAGAIVLGLNDALVELTGALAGFTLALQNTNIIAVSGLVMGIAAALSMASSGYQSAKADGTKNPFRSALYTGITYFIVVLILITPYLLSSEVYSSLLITLILAIIIIAAYNFFITTAKSLKFWPRFIEMTLISLIIATISFGIGYLLKITFNI